MLPVLINQPWLTLYSYPFFMGIGWAVGYLYAEAAVKKYHLQLEKYFPWIFLGYFLSAWIGAKSLFLITTTPVQRLMYANATNFWLGGGFVFYGGLIGALIFTIGIKVLLRKKLTGDFFYHLLPGLIAGHAVGRIGCLLAGCCFGRESQSFLAVMTNGVARLPVPLFESMGLGVILLLVVSLFKKQKNTLGVAAYFLGYALLRFILEIYRADEIRGFYYGLSTSQWISLAMAIVGFYFLFKNKLPKSSV